MEIVRLISDYRTSYQTTSQNIDLAKVNIFNDYYGLCLTSDPKSCRHIFKELAQNHLFFREFNHNTSKLALCPITLTKPQIGAVKENRKTTNVHERKYELINSLENLAHFNTIQLSADYYLNRYCERQNIKACPVSAIDYNVQPLSKVGFELPCNIKDCVYEEPKKDINQNTILYINPTAELKIISDPLLPNKTPVEDAPNGK